MEKRKYNKSRREKGLTPKARAFAKLYADGLSASEACKAAGFANATNARKMLARGVTQEEIAQYQNKRLFDEVLPLALSVHIDLLTNPATPAGARVQAVKLAYDRTLGTDGAKSSKQPHEMTPQELQRALDDARLKAATFESIKADRATPVIDVEVSLFG